ncbi:hypothetical protein [Xanthomonas vesicatoria]|uniref:hypothetical protein n=1 Tax=Xanthomonas vesicatoria TaxID=56460 RepID=UPI001E302E10|nr:hypothetical protein [Xanthomonas vesicatoria]MCC8616816.1 hypothetical protein [Xanthomonas vesicatoria]
MGTSTSSRGASNRSPLVPPWADVDGQGPGPDPEENRFKSFRTHLGKFVASGDGQQLSKALHSYARSSTGGSAVGPRRFGAVAQAGAGLFGTLNQLRTNSAGAPVNLVALSGRPTREVINALVDALVPENGDADRIRTALNEALSICLDGVEAFDFASITDEILVNLMVTYTALSIFQAIVMDSDKAFTKADTPEAVERAEKELMQLVEVVTDKHMKPLLSGNISQLTTDEMQAVQIAAIKEVWTEWEDYQS